jgi:hypothetical protein
VRERESNEYDHLLSQLELWTEELAARGPRALPQIYREMARLVEPLQSFAHSSEEPDFNHQKNYE